jgi:hypothetical protein
MPFTVGHKMQAGRVLTGSDGTATVTFPEPFGTTPKVFLQGVDSFGRGIVVDLVSVSETGFTMKARVVTAIPSDTVANHSHSIILDGAHVHKAASGGSTLGWTTPAYRRPLYLYSSAGGTVGVGDLVRGSEAASEDYYTLGAGTHSHGGSTGSAGGHSHSSTAPAISIYVDWLAVEV